MLTCLVDFAGTKHGGGLALAANFVTELEKQRNNNNIRLIYLCRSSIFSNLSGKVITANGIPFFLTTLRSLLPIYLRLKYGKPLLVISWGGLFQSRFADKNVVFLHNSIVLENISRIKEAGIIKKCFLTIYKIFFFNSIKRTDHLIVSSLYAFNKIKTKGIQISRVEILKNPILDDRWMRNSWKKNISQGDFRIISTASYSPHKGFFSILNALDRLYYEGIDFQFENFGAIGDRTYYLELLKRLDLFPHLQARVNLNSDVSTDVLIERFNASDIFLFCSDSETSSLALMEASSFGIPIVAFDEPYIIEDAPELLVKITDRSYQSIFVAIRTAYFNYYLNPVVSTNSSSKHLLNKREYDARLRATVKQLVEFS